MNTAGRLRLRTIPGGELAAEANLNVNTISLMVSNVLTCVLGLVYWGAAARVFPAEDVGVAAALINSALMLSTLSILSIDRFYERFLPVAGHRAGELISRGFLLVTAVSMAGGIALIVFGPRETLFTSDWVLLAYPLFVVVIAVFILQDKVLAGLGVARWAAVKNTGLAVGKLAVLLAVATLAGSGALMGTAAASTAIVAAWGSTAALIAAYFFVVISRRCRQHPRFSLHPNLPPWKDIWSYFGSSFGIAAMLSTGALLVPLIVVAQAGPAANAHFQIAWQFVSALYLTIHLVVSPYVAEAATHPDKIPALSWRTVRMLIAVAVVGCAGLILVAPPMLSLIGSDYRTGSEDLLLLAAIFVPLSVIGAAYEGFARVQRKLRLQLFMTFVWTLTVVGGSLIATRYVGVTGVGWAYLAAESICAVVLIGPAVMWLRKRMYLPPTSQRPSTEPVDG
ncbi:lipopolysaccharide biosynthesis protein [Mycolicibacterium austroafricanum]|uniref:Lipopolysaccharide biosynthesis protein n=1 Tax=Mycolicibacterium austroafricanum TaxID=39687 RepID=A0ABT8H742_MYCAO|nr:lipopolysaccharide biosynthesis protein [Mycolicibacterium austroafricanum]MDN4516576.1 lipopolysaccharide biosynthesis protein [Mycolicibacterium austroafricanum]QRZ05049.1 lipopolysaccharide biosynthesis protein [Mycolicibacterium austroafricanum]QZT68704.1 lipopolysaccharide biosynthesis protein [Mycolicibacterium austroafricanum]